MRIIQTGREIDFNDVCHNTKFFKKNLVISCYLHVRAPLKALVYMVLWSNYNAMPMGVVNSMFYLVITSDATIYNFHPGDNTDLLNWVEPNVICHHTY